MDFLRSHGAGLTPDSIWLEVGSGPMRPGMVALQQGAGAAIGIEVVEQRHLLAVLGGVAIAKHRQQQEEMIGM